MIATGIGGEGVEGLSKKEKRLMDMDNSVRILGKRGSIKLLNGNGKNTIKMIPKNINVIMFIKYYKIG